MGIRLPNLLASGDDGGRDGWTVRCKLTGRWTDQARPGWAGRTYRRLFVYATYLYILR